jgi:DNA polymerase-3 subunit epsilon
METIAVVDFETTGLGPTSGGRATEIAAVLVRGGEVVDAWSSLMNSGAWVPPQIQALTGITNAMLAAPDAASVMREPASPQAVRSSRITRLLIGASGRPRWRAPAGADPAHQFACTVLLSRRLWPEAQPWAGRDDAVPRPAFTAVPTARWPMPA